MTLPSASHYIRILIIEGLNVISGTIALDDSPVHAIILVRGFLSLGVHNAKETLVLIIEELRFDWSDKALILSSKELDIRKLLYIGSWNRQQK